MTGSPVGDIIDTLGSNGHLEIESTLILRGDPPGLLKQDPQLRISVGRPDMSQDRSMTSMFTHDLHRDRT